MAWFSDGITWMVGQLRDAAGETVSLHRGAYTTSSVTAVVVDHDQVIENAKTLTTSIIDRVWTIAKSAYLINAVAVEPKAGDRIVGSDLVEWEVLPQTAVPAAVSYHAASDWLISTKRVKA